ncbi:HIT family protein [Kitasatospora sp. NPDC052896]|uniref:HIT family protein n=1 Tax=Kitasatospora sp. NPDC052896 TaxID=3364061 RepID=UPI0037C891BB
MSEFDLAAYAQRAQHGPCFICAMLDGEPGFEHPIVCDDGSHIAFLDRYPTVPGKLLVAPRAHITDPISGFSEPQYLALQSVVHKVSRALQSVLPVARVYVMSLGSNEGYAHVHWHIAGLPHGVPYERQQFHALMAETSPVLDVGAEQAADLAACLRAAL